MHCYTAILGVLGYGLLWFRLSMNYDSEPIFKPEEMRAAFHPNRTVRSAKQRPLIKKQCNKPTQYFFCRILSFSNLYCFNTWLLLSPSSLCCDWTLGSIPVVTSLSDVRNAWSIFLYSSILLLVLHALLSKRDRVQLGMGLSLLLLPFLPASGVPVRVGFVIAERCITHNAVLVLQ